MSSPSVVDARSERYCGRNRRRNCPDELLYYVILHNCGDLIPLHYTVHEVGFCDTVGSYRNVCVLWVILYLEREQRTMLKVV